MMTAKREIARADIMALADYLEIRADRRRQVATIKRDRRVEVGPAATFYFESYDTLWHQIHEMLAIEKGGEEQIDDELAAYNPLVPKGGELVATLMFEIDDPGRRDALLRRLGGIEHRVTLAFDGETVRAVPEGDVERTDASGKTSAVHFLHFPFTPARIDKFRRAGADAVLGFDHAAYGHLAVIPEAVRAALAEDFD
ncbi:MAG: DUF3501 family protein [Alphaproteobacteria bacterium]